MIQIVKFLYYLSVYFPDITYFIGKIFANLLYILGIRKRIVLKNLAIAFPDKDIKWRRKIVKKCYEFFVFQSVWTAYYYIYQEKLNERLVIKGMEPYLKAIKNKKQIFYYSAHFGSWEIATLYFEKNFRKTICLYQKVHNEQINKFLLNFRKKTGGIYVNRRNTRTMLKYIKMGYDLASIVDQRPIEEGIIVNFFNTKLPFYSIPFKLAKKFDGDIFFVFSYYKNGLFYIEIKECKEKELDNIVQDYAKTLEEYIKKCPEQYFWLHNRWKERF
jgi:KDO2-lipid IV(A) lauroyltransferase